MLARTALLSFLSSFPVGIMRIPGFEHAMLAGPVSSSPASWGQSEDPKLQKSVLRGQYRAEAEDWKLVWTGWSREPWGKFCKGQLYLAEGRQSRAGGGGWAIRARLDSSLQRKAKSVFAIFLIQTLNKGKYLGSV